MFDRRPALILRTTDLADIVAGVNFTRERDLDISVHGGGHDVAGNAAADG